MTLGPYARLATPYFASQADQRFGYYLYVPADFTPEAAASFSLLVVVHGTGRTAESYRNHFAEFGHQHKCIVMAPLFPAGIGVPGEVNNYKFLEFEGIRFDRLLLAMIAEVGSAYGLATERFLLHGFSGGGQFVHRFFYLHASRLLGVSIGAPGLVTLLDDSRRWHCGTSGMAETFGGVIDIEAMRRVPVQLVIGSEDTERWEITVEPTSRLWMAGVNDAGATRLERLEALGQSLTRAGIDVRHDVVPGVAHEGFRLLEPVRRFFGDVLGQARTSARLAARPLREVGE